MNDWHSINFSLKKSYTNSDIVGIYTEMVEFLSKNLRKGEWRMSYGSVDFVNEADKLLFLMRWSNYFNLTSSNDQ
jgi:hypothetical protein